MITRRGFIRATGVWMIGLLGVITTTQKPVVVHDCHETIIRSNLSYIHYPPYIGEAGRRGSGVYVSHDIIAPSFGEGVRKG